MDASAASQTDFAILWRQATDGFDQKCGIPLREICLPAPQKPGDLIRSIDQHHQHFEEYIKRGEEIRAVLKSVLRPVGFFSDIVAAGASVAFPPAQAILGAVKYLINTVENVGDAYDAILELLERIQAFTSRLRYYFHHEIPDVLRPILVQYLTIYLTVLAISIKRMRGSRIGFFFKALVGNDEGIDDALKKLDNLFREENSAVSVLTYDSVMQQKALLAGVSQDVARIASFLGVYSLNLAEQHLVEKIAPEYPSADIFEGIQSTLDQNVVSWVEYETEFEAWLSGESQLLWIQGDPGTGKSYIACKVIQILKEMYQEDPKPPHTTSVAYFFCKPGRPVLLSTSALVRTLAYQIAKEDKAFAAHVNNIPDLQFQHDTSTLWANLFERFFLKNNTTSTAFIVIYGLDEVERQERAIFLDLLAKFQHNNGLLSKPRLSVLLVSCPLGNELKDRFGIDNGVVDVTEKTRLGMTWYIKCLVPKELSYTRSRKKIRKEIEETLRDHAKGSFLWVNTMVAQLKGIVERNAVNDVLKQAPMKWNELFCNNLQHLASTLSESQINVLNYLLVWVVPAFRPLSVRALGQALRIRSDGNGDVMDLLDLISLRYGLVFSLKTRKGAMISSKTDVLELENESKKSRNISDERSWSDFSQDDDENGDDSDEEDEESEMDDDSVFVSLKHDAIREFFLSGSAKGDIKIVFDTSTAAIAVLRSCLRILCDQRAYKKCSDDLAFYAAQLNRHMERVDPSSLSLEEKSEIAALLVQLFCKKELSSRWLDHSRLFLTTEILFSDEFIAKVQQFLTALDGTASLQQDDSMGPWLSSLSSSPYECLFKEIATECRHRWLEGDSPHFEHEVMFLYSYMVKVQKASNVEEPSSITHPFLHLQQLGSDGILRLAQQVHFEDTSNQLYRLADTFLRAGCVPEAIQRAHESIKKNPRNGLSFAILAKAYTRQNKLAKACEALTMSQEMLAESGGQKGLAAFDTLYKYGTSPLPDVFSNTDDSELDHYFFENYMEAVIRRGDYNGATNAIQRAINFKMSFKAAQRWKPFFLELSSHMPHHQRLVVYALKTGQVDLVEALYKRGLEVLGRCHVDGAQPVFRYCYAEFHLQLDLQTDHAVLMLKQAVDEFSQQQEIEKRYLKIKYYAEIKLQAFYLANALITRPMVDLPVVQVYEEYFQQLAKKLSKPDQQLSVSNLALTVWYREKNRFEYRTTIRGLVLDALERIKSEDAADSLNGWYRLSNALTAAGEKEDAVAALSYIKQSRLPSDDDLQEGSDDQENSDVQDDSEDSDVQATNPRRTVKAEALLLGPGLPAPKTAGKDSNASLKDKENLQSASDDVDSKRMALFGGIYSGFSCNTCATLIMATEDHYRCCICINVDLCKHCLGVLTAGEMKLKVCSATHLSSFILVPAALSSYEEGKIQTGKQERGWELDQWMNELRAKWSA